MLKSLLDESAKAYDASIAEVTRLENLVMDKTNGEHAKASGTPSKDAELTAAEEMVKATIKRLEIVQKESAEQRNVIEEMELRRESAEHLLRQQRSAIAKRDGLVQELREELDKSASAHAKQTRKMDFDYRNRIGRLESTINILRGKLAAAAETTAPDSEKEVLDSHDDEETKQKLQAESKHLLEIQGGRIFELEQALMSKNEKIADLRHQLASLGEENTELQTKVRTKSSESVVTLEALNFFDIPSFAPLNVSEDQLGYSSSSTPKHGNEGILSMEKPNSQDKQNSGVVAVKPKRPRMSDMAESQTPVLMRMRSKSKIINGQRARELVQMCRQEQEKRHTSLQSDSSSHAEDDSD